MATAGTALAAGPDAGSLLNEQRQTFPKSLDRLPQGDGLGEEAPPPLAPGAQTVVIASVRFTGAEGLAREDELQALVQPSLGKPLSFAELQALADKTTKFLKAKGWMLARAYLPRQDLSDGVLEIAVIQGRIDGQSDGSGIAVTAAPDTRLDPERVRQTMAGALYDGDTATLRGDDLERGVLLLNDLPGIEAKSSLEKGGTPGTTRIGVQIKEGPLVTGSVWGDNYGNRYTGANRGNALASLNDPFGWGDQLSLTGSGSSGNRQVGGIYSVPLGTSGLRANAGVTALRYELGSGEAALHSRGMAVTETAGLSYPVLRSRDGSLWGNLAYVRKDLRDESRGFNTDDKRINEVTYGVNGDHYDQFLGGGLINYQLTGTTGDLDRSRNAADLATDLATAGSNGSFTKLTYSLARLQKLTEEVSLFASVNGQFADKNLDSSEKFILGGPSGVRAYPVGEGSGDSGWISNIEVRYDVPNLESWGIGQLQLISFFDIGGVTLQHGPWQTAADLTGRNSYLLKGAGVGINLTQTGLYSLRLAWATALGDNPGRTLTDTNTDGKTSRNRLWLQAMINF